MATPWSCAPTGRFGNGRCADPRRRAFSARDRSLGALTKRALPMFIDLREQGRRDGGELGDFGDAADSRRDRFSEINLRQLACRTTESPPRREVEKSLPIFQSEPVS